MNEEICCITNARKMAKNEWENDFDFFPTLCIVYEKQGNSFFILYLLTCLKKDTPVLLQAINI